MFAVEDNQTRVKTIRREIIRCLKDLANQEVARRAQRFFPGKIDCFGVGASDLRTLSRDIYIRLGPPWSISQALELAEALVYHQKLESRSCGLLILSFFHSELNPVALDRIKAWLEKGYLDNWALIDTLSLEVLGPFFLRNPSQLRIIKPWARDDSPYLRRAALVTLVKLAGERKNLDLIYKTIRSAVTSDKTEDLVAKAAGWLLREAGKTDRKLLEDFLLKFGQRLPRVTVRYALEKFPAESREFFMKKTKINISKEAL